MGNLTWKPIREVHVGEKILGFSESTYGHYWLLEEGTIIAKIRRRLPTYRIITDMGEVAATSQHLWLVDRGRWRTTEKIAKWAFPLRFLSKPIERPKFNEEYMKGYIRGFFDCSETFSHYKTHTFLRAALTDEDFLQRLNKFLERFGYNLPIRPFNGGNPSRMLKMETWIMKISDGIMELTKYSSSQSYIKGYLAGIFDAGGSISNALRISNHDEELKKRIADLGKKIGLNFQIEEHGICLVGGLQKTLEFFALTYPSIRRKKRMRGAIKIFPPHETLKVEKGETEYVYDITTTCQTFFANGFASHNCWSRNYAKRLASMGVEPYKTHGFNPTLAEWRLRKVPNGKFIFVSDMSDMWGMWVSREWIERVLRVVRSKPRSWFFFLTKNPGRYLEFEGEFPNNVVLGATIETNRDYKLTGAPAPRERYEAMVKLKWRWKAVVIEPILDFDEEFIDWIYEISPVIVYVGYDNYNNRLPEPKLEKTMILLEALRGITDLRPKTIRKAWYET